MTSPTTSTKLKPPLEAIAQFLDNLDGVASKRSWGEIAWFHNPGGVFASGAYVATIKLRDGPNDSASRLDADGAVRLNFGMLRSAFVARFGQPPMRPPKGGSIEGPWDLLARDRLQPHPVYGWMCWAAIAEPSPGSVEMLKPLLLDAWSRAAEKSAARFKGR
ncbi:MAG TPA: DUF6194 family protein [Rhizobiaceae bacterium]|nr:DUF6194 family protein [Rhizobiaceae bacterium]